MEKSDKKLFLTIALKYLNLIFIIIVALISFSKAVKNDISIGLEIIKYIQIIIIIIENIVSLKNNVLEKNTLKCIIIMEIIAMLLLMAGLFIPASLLFKDAIIQNDIIIFQKNLINLQKILNYFALDFSVLIYPVISTSCQIVHAVTQFIVEFVTKTQNKK